jgi:hypothetical protein
MMTQDELLNLINNLRDRTISTNDFKKLKIEIERRVRIKGAHREDVVMITLEKICYSRTEVRNNEVNLFIRHRINDAYYKAGIANSNTSKIPNQYRIKYQVVDDEILENISVEGNAWKDFIKAEFRADLLHAYRKSRSDRIIRFEAGGGLFDGISQECT